MTGLNRRQVLGYSLASFGLAALASQARPQSASAAGLWTYPFAQPAHYETSNPFGNAAPGYDYGHRGSDFNQAPDPVVRAVRSGRVAWAGWDDFARGELGITVVVEHDTHWSMYSHLQPGSVRVRLDQIVAGGAPLGVMGNTGKSTSTHLHLEIGIGAFDRLRPLHKLLDPYQVVGTAPLPGTTSDPEPQPEGSEEVPIYTFNESAHTHLIKTAEYVPLQFAPVVYNLASGTGGPGLYDITVHATFSGLEPDKRLLLRWVRENASTNVRTPVSGVSFPGIVGGTRQIAISAKIPVASGQKLLVDAMCPEGGVSLTRLASSTMVFTEYA